MPTESTTADLADAPTSDASAEEPQASSGILYLITAVLSDNGETPGEPRASKRVKGDAKATKERAKGRRVRDAWLVRSKRELRYEFRYATVLVRRKRYSSIRAAVKAIQAFEAEVQAGESTIDDEPAAYHWVSLRPNGDAQPNEAVSRVLLCESDDGAVGKTEHDAIYERFLDFGEHSVAVSPAGIAIAGEVDEAQIEVYLYYVAQIAAAISRYAANESFLNKVMEDIHTHAAQFDVEQLQEINISTSKAMLDISDELLDIPPRERFILSTLLSVANVDVYEERIARMLGLVQHHVQHHHALIAKRNSHRIEFVLFIIAMLGGFTGLVTVATDVTSVSHNWWLGLGTSSGVFLATMLSALWFYRLRARDLIRNL